MKRKVEKDYYALAESRGFEWVGRVLPKNVVNKTLWQCKKEHRWQARYNDIRNGTGCPICSNHIKKIEKDYYNIGKDSGIIWVGNILPKTTGSKTVWSCIENKHIWYASYSNIRASNGCPYCSGRVKKTKENYYSLAYTRNFEWLGEVLPPNVFTKTLWKCVHGHKWYAKYNTIYSGAGCPFCASNGQKLEEDYYRLADTYNILWLGKKSPKNIQVKTLWGCKKGHQWLARYHNIQGGTGCPKCKDIINGSLVSKPQRRLNEMLHGSLNYPEARYRIDVAIMRNSQKIAVEYDAQYWHQGNEEHDEKRDRFLISRGWKVLHIKSGKLFPTRKQLKKKINELLKSNTYIVNLYLDDWKNENNK